MNPPKPASRPERVSLLRYLALFRRDILSAQPARLYRARMAEFRTPFFRSFLVNEPALIREVLNQRPGDFPKSNRIGEGLRPLLGNSVFLTNGEEWQFQRRIIDPAFEGGRLRDTYPAMLSAAQDAVTRLQGQVGRAVEVEQFASHATADVIFRTLFSVPITDHLAMQVFEAFRRYQRQQPILNLAAFVPLPRWLPRFHRRATRASARRIRKLIGDLTRQRQAQIAGGQAPDDLASKIMTQTDPVTGQRFDTEQMIDQVAIFFLAGHETSAASLGWALYLLALYPEWQDRVAAEAANVADSPDFAQIAGLKIARNVYRETLRLYPPVPMMVRQNTGSERFRNRDIGPGSQIVLSPWHLHRHERHWDRPDAFDPGRFATQAGRISMREAYLPFSAGPRVCPGAGFAMTEGVLLLALLVRKFRFEIGSNRVPVPVAHLTVRSANGISLNVKERS